MKRVIVGLAVSVLLLLSMASGRASTGGNDEEIRMRRVGCIIEKYYERRRELRDGELKQAAIGQDIKRSPEERRSAAMLSMVYFEAIKDLDPKFNERFALLVKLPVNSAQYPDAVEQFSNISPGFGWACPMYFQN